MRILLLSDVGNAHTQKWAKGLSSAGIEVFIFGLSEFDKTIYQNHPHISAYSLSISAEFAKSGEGRLAKLKYLKALPELKRVIKEFKPDIMHAHYASSYGLLGSMSGFHPFILSVWGSDVFDFPNKGFPQKVILKRNLEAADVILSTSEVMKAETLKFTDKDILVTPFGVNTREFAPIRNEKEDLEKPIVIGTVKTLEEKYGITYLIQAFAKLVHAHPKLPLELLIVGKGKLKDQLEKEAELLGIRDKVTFKGWVPTEEVYLYHNKLDVAVYPSVLDSESFGVSAIESSACEVPVVVSKVGGLAEVVLEGVTGLMVKKEDVTSLFEAIKTLVLDESLRIRMGKAGRAHVIEKYEWQTCLAQMIEIYHQTLKSVK